MNKIKKNYLSSPSNKTAGQFLNRPLTQSNVFEENKQVSSPTFKFESEQTKVKQINSYGLLDRNKEGNGSPEYSQDGDGMMTQS